jgi:DegV family protein with EDD domain
MSNTGIVTDSINGLSPELIKQYGIRVVPMGVNVNGKGYRDLVDISTPEFCRIFKEVTKPGTTSAATPGDFVKAFESLLPGAGSIIYIGVSAALTATFKSAFVARTLIMREHPEVTIELFDTKNCLGAMGFMILEAARATEKGQSLPEIVQQLQGMVSRVKYISILDTLQHLLRIGRIPPSAASTERLHFRPMIGMTDTSGNMQNFEPAPSGLALDRLVELMARNIEPGQPVHAMVHYSENIQEAKMLQEKIIARFNPVEFYLTEYSPAALCSTGMETGIAFYT